MLQQDEVISLILISLILILTEINEQFFTFYLKKQTSVMSIFVHLFHHVVFSTFSVMKGDDNYNQRRNNAIDTRKISY